VWPRTGSVQSLGRLPGGRDSQALAINDRGDIVGSARTGAGVKHAFIWSNGRMTDLGTLSGDAESEAFGVNNAGDVVGTSTGAGRTHAVLWRNGVPQDLGTLPGGFLSRAMAINDRGDVVGTSSVDHDLHAFVWTAAGGLQDLNSLVPPSPFILMEASAVNTRGVILAIGRDASADDPHDHHAEFPVRVFLLEPQP
jgi:probable HAF family extracellular repeat protein